MYTFLIFTEKETQHQAIFSAFKPNITMSTRTVQHRKSVTYLVASLMIKVNYLVNFSEE